MLNLLFGSATIPRRAALDLGYKVCIYREQTAYSGIIAVVFHDHANSTPRPDAEVIMSECDAPDRCGSLGYGTVAA